MLEICNISKKYNTKDTFFSNKNINLKIDEGEIIGFLGANGAGKTTLIKIICNLISPTNGKVLINGKDIKDNPDEVHKNVGVVLEGARNVYNFLSIDYNIDYFTYLNKLDPELIKERKEKLLELFELKEKHDVPVNSLSRGMQQKVAIIVALLKNPDILILDEPTLGLDVVSKEKMIKLLKEIATKFNKTLIVSSHEMNVIENLCDKIAFFNKGQLTQYDTINNLKFSNNYTYSDVVVVKQDNIVEYLKKNHITYTEEDDFLDFKIKNVVKFISEFPDINVIKIEKEYDKIESLFN
ncbi:ABC transporter ATP-binding protein [Inconstantimicrobium porci]|uniref:ABC transporter ATP-binding protein n=1 Tax=Inconstantimicrobium porci TaxID=2652291 RepID=A0A7X2MYI4_9CLOT|nr:ABC transporter ATP-binding protein [Inconstantimicrobium porci]MSR91444.1 ABC transporter ATP-binding protein [Inconstantimicrobium porci]